ncbi:hypothetical protein ACLOJK_004905, partial [Asimina triloba]
PRIFFPLPISSHPIPFHPQLTCPPSVRCRLSFIDCIRCMRRKEERGSFSFEGNVVWLEAASRVLPKPQSIDPDRPRLRSNSPAAVGPGFIPPNFQLPKPLVRSSLARSK